MEHNDKGNHHCGQLFIVATPIGNLADMTFRAVDVLKSVALIAAEDTRNSGRLLQHYGIDTPMCACHDHNEGAMVKRLLERLQQGDDIALISDAGTPLINDPGYRLVHQMRKAEINIVPIPGACSPIAALSAAGLPTDQFVYLGFLARSGQARQMQMTELKSANRTSVLLESPKRLLKTLQEMSFLGMEKRDVCVARELTKLYESFITGSLDEVIAHFDQHPPKGEIVVLLGPDVLPKDVSDDTILQMLAADEMVELPPSGRARNVAKKLGVSKSRVYALQIEVQVQPQEQDQ
ncbi:MAG: 16S rRNA (cytidine(1402)-2'-O)-methyltransferase [Mariprofundaceae bacterium]